jgi:hypothetical protein
VKRREMRALWELRRLLGEWTTIQINSVPGPAVTFPWQVYADFGDGRTFLSGGDTLAEALEGACAHARRIALTRRGT